MTRFALVPLLLALSPAAMAKVYEFQDWAIACDNTRHCEANGTQSQDSDNPVSLLLSRDAGPGAALTGLLQVADPDDGKVGKLTLKAGKLNWRGLAPEQALSAAQMKQLLPEMLNADSAVLNDGRHQWTLSLAGLKAALLKMDDAQGRVGTAGALVKKGGKPDAAALPALPAPLLRPAETPPAQAADKTLLPALLREARKTAADCWSDLPDSENPDSGLYRLGGAQVLLLRECSRGAYQGGFQAWLANDKPPYRPRPLKLKDEDGQPAELMNASFDKGVLSSYGKLRGIGDCGDSYSWAWTGRELKLMSADKAPQCRGIAGGVPLRTWATRQK
ncbi:DUF1176 domain-containing protein [Chromobacterium sp. IIBBL 290-4]|uniref:DUF1176 domain-containing protein n=1 Tax=Chromobacterium sp. IIBBL 290-4 TaxID=2953890 RepID=UPI0020B73A9C|nr:DUF1176 domain-containing protein [Chromobacterium sp. IIBBL 290-4]UTH74679.1 DUF1176 domain-containing protein [Chromobacterium sp. IIBBL 290-4]